ncbi:MAG: hypothetical protein K5666_03770 [Bacilli bacterium]|nr:hypothetical protein [Bacilli bacterium]
MNRGFGIFGIICGACAFIPVFLITSVTMDVFMILSLVGVALGILAIVFAAKGLKESVGTFVVGLILGIIAIFVMGLMAVGAYAITHVTNCVEKKDSLVCEFAGESIDMSKELKSYLREDQFKK